MVKLSKLGMSGREWMWLVGSRRRGKGRCCLCSLLSPPSAAPSSLALFVAQVLLESIADFCGLAVEREEELAAVAS